MSGDWSRCIEQAIEAEIQQFRQLIQQVKDLESCSLETANRTLQFIDRLADYIESLIKKMPSQYDGAAYHGRVNHYRLVARRQVNYARERNAQHTQQALLSMINQYEPLEMEVEIPLPPPPRELVTFHRTITLPNMMTPRPDEQNKRDRDESASVVLDNDPDYAQEELADETAGAWGGEPLRHNGNMNESTSNNNDSVVNNNLSGVTKSHPPDNEEEHHLITSPQTLQSVIIRPIRQFDIIPRFQNGAIDWEAIEPGLCHPDIGKRQKWFSQPPPNQTGRPRRCPKCDGPHQLYRCQQFLDENLLGRWRKINNELGVCHRCFSKSHRTATCFHQEPCCWCSDVHNTTICPVLYRRQLLERYNPNEVQRLPEYQSLGEQAKIVRRIKRRDREHH